MTKLHQKKYNLAFRGPQKDRAVLAKFLNGPNAPEQKLLFINLVIWKISYDTTVLSLLGSEINNERTQNTIIKKAKQNFL